MKTQLQKTSFLNMIKTLSPQKAKCWVSHSLFRNVLLVFFIVLGILSTSKSKAQVSMTSSPTSYSQNFDVLSATSEGTNVTWTDNSTISGWYANQTTYRAWNTATAPTISNRIYSFGSSTSSTDRALGSHMTSTTIRVVMVRLTNSTGATLNDLTLGFDLELYSTVGTGSNFVWQYSIDQTAAIGDATNSTKWTTVASETSAGAKSTTLSSLNLSNGSFIQIRFYEAYSGSTSNYKLWGVDNFTANWASCTAPTSKTVSGTAAICSGASTNVTLTASQSGVTYELYKDAAATGTTVSGDGTDKTFSVNAIGTYTVKTTTAGGYCATDMTGSAVITAATAPNIGSQSTVGASYGQNASASALTVSATGTSLTYQWYSSNDAVTNTAADDVTVGTNSNSYTPSTAIIGTKYYYCVVSGQCNPAATSAVSGAIIVTAPLSNPPSLTAAGSATVDAPFNITYTDDATWRGAVTAVQVGGIALSGTAYSFSSGILTLTPANDSKLQTPGSKSINVIATGYNNATLSQTIAVGAVASMSITTQPTAPGNNGAVLATQPVVTLRDQYNNTVTTSSANITATTSGGTWVLGGTATVAAVSGVATFSGLTAGTADLSALSGATITFSTSGATNVVSNSFTIPVYVPYAVGDYSSVASGSWTSFATTWRQWDGTGWNTVPTAVPTTSNTVWILGGYTVTVPNSGTRTCNDLHVLNGQLTAGNVVKTPIGLTIAGDTIEVTTNGILGSNTGLTGGDAADALRLDLSNTGTTRIIGTGGIVNICRIVNTGAGSTVIIDRDVIVNYHGNANKGNASGYHSSASSNTLTINAGRTLTFAAWSCYQVSGSSTAAPNQDQTININGTMTFTGGKPSGRTVDSIPAFSNGTSYMIASVASGKTVTINIGSTGTLNLQQFYPNGTTQGTGFGNLTLNNSGTINISDTAILNTKKTALLSLGNVTINASSVVNVPDTSTIAVGDGKTITNNGILLLKSTSNGTASVASSTGTISGNVTVERYIPSNTRRRYVLVGSPASGASIYNAWQEGGASNAGYGTLITGGAAGGTLGFDLPTTSGKSIFTYNDNNASGSKWVGLANTNATNLSTGAGYLLFVRGDRTLNLATTPTASGNTTLRATGTIGQGSISPTLLSGANKYTLIANPYPCAIDWNSGSITKTNLTGNFTVYDANNNVFVSSNGTVKTPNVGNQQAGYIQSGQAFFVQNDGTGNGAITFTEGAKTTSATTSSSTTVFGEAANNAQLNINVYHTADNSFVDGAVALFGSKYKAAVDANEDIYKFTNLNETFGLRRNNVVLGLEARPAVSSKDSLYFSLSNFAKKAYSLVIDGSNLASTTAKLEDKYTGTTTEIDVTGTTTYNFTVTEAAASYSNDRFFITFGSTTASSAVIDGTAASSLYVKMSPNPVSNQLQVSFKTATVEAASINVVNSLGQVVKTVNAGNVANGNISVPVSELANGVYSVQLLSGNKVIHTQRVVKTAN